MWGRNVYDNIRKFLQFQLTVNVVALLTVFIAACAGKAPPLNAVQMLWVNLIMDTLGALALATEPPTDALLDRMPYKRSAALVSKPMWRNIMCQSVYQTILIMVLMFAGEKMFDVKPHEWCRDWGLLDSPSSNTFDASGTAMTCAEVHSYVNNNCSDDLNGECYEELVFDNSNTFGSDRHDFSEDCLECNLHDYHHATIMFNAFIFCQFFNEYTARSIGDEWNCFKGLMLNPVFLFVSVFTLLIQIVLIVFCGDYIGTMPYPGISLNEWLITVALGALSLPVGVMMRFIPMQEDPNDFFQSGASMRKAKTIDLYPDAKEEAAKVASQ
jgi:magnesium-transporting ATPase (P-type)